MKNEFVLAFNEVLEEKQLPKEVVLDALAAAMVSAYRRAVNASNAQHVDAKVDPDTGKVVIFAEKEVVDSVQDPRTEVTLRDAQKVEPEAKLGSMVIVESTPHNFGRVAAQTARQVIQQRIREAERNAQFSHYSKQLGEIISGIIQTVNNQGVTLGMDMKAEGSMPRNQQIPSERFRVHDRVRALLLEVKDSPRGPQIILSRAHRNFLRRLLENEVPEIYHGMVEIRSIAREPGQRSKVAVAALQPGVDPVGACVGIRGVRIQAIVRELNDEKIDVIEWNSDPAAYIAKALSPARVAGVYLNEHAKGAKTATVVVQEDQLSLAIGRDGQNARLAAKLTSWRIDIKSLPEAANDALTKLRSDPQFLTMASHEADTVRQVEAILDKKAEGRPVTPEEYHTMTQFVDRVERGVVRQRQTESKAEEEQLKSVRSSIPPAAFDIQIQDFQVSDRLYAVISEAGFATVGDLMLQMKLDPDSLLKLSGMGPKAMKELETALDKLTAALQPPAPEPEPEPAAPEAVEPAPVELVEVSTEAEPVQAGPVEVAPVETLPVAEVQPQVEAVVPVEEPAVAAPVEAVAAPVVAQPEEAEKVQEAAPAAADAGTAPAAPTSEEEDASNLDELWDKIRPEDMVDSTTTEDEDEDDLHKKKKKGKKKFVEMEYDPDKDVMVVKKKRKRGAGDWEEEW
jgi:N utilization substance protein A